MSERNEIESLKRGLRAIEFLNRQGDMTATQLAGGVEVSRATAYRLLQTLAGEGYVDKLPNSDLYRLTSRVRRLSAGFQDIDLLIEMARPLLAEAQRELGWSISLSMPRGTEMVVRLNTDHDSPLALIRYAVGASLPIVLSTGGYCYLAHASASEREAIVDAAFQQVDPRDLVRFDRAQVEALIAQARADGFCHLEFDHYREGNLGVPMLLAGRAVGGIVMRYIKSTLKNTNRLRDSYAPRLQRLAQEIVERHPAQMAWVEANRQANTPDAGAS